MTEKEKMIAGKPYFAFDKALFKERQLAKEKVYDFNFSKPSELDKRNTIIQSLLGKTSNSFYIEPPFRCDYGYNIEIGDNFYSNYNLIILDCAKVTIGNNVLVGPNVSLFAAGHPIHHEVRNTELEYAFPITIGNNVWIGGNVVVNADITIGDNTVIASGSIVTKDIPSNVIAAGNPCKVLREITDEDKQYYFKKLRI
ncbi:sugar O-acetyltransferase [Saccharicrinis aurantiacus]|uniref:sugar O-acetyltransferase n=1 Tax=Saccharicrinis aurantiacus TaxID=1849719 RepID=UPI0024900581|nr:sugar O-acetyltransferase [Saccharicrinis aurantiacus]